MSSDEIERVSVDSKSLRSIGYSKDQGILQVEFRNGRVYRHYLVPAAIWSELLASDSKGAYFNHFIRDRFPQVPVYPDRPDHLLADLERSLEALQSRKENEDLP